MKISSIARFSGLLIATIVVLALLSAAIVYPVWFASQTDKDSFAFAGILTAAAILSILFIFRTFRSIKETRADEFYKTLLKIFMFLGFWALQAILAGAFILSFSAGTSPQLYSPVPFLIAAVLFLISTGILLSSLNANALIGPGGFRFFCIFNMLHGCFWSAALFFRGNLLDFAITTAGILGTLAVTLYGGKLFSKKTGNINPS